MERIPGIDGTLLDYSELGFVDLSGNPGHKGCLYSHTEFLLQALGKSDCGLPQLSGALPPARYTRYTYGVAYRERRGMRASGSDLSSLTRLRVPLRWDACR